MKKTFFVISVFILGLILYGFHIFKEEELIYPNINYINVQIEGNVKIPGSYKVNPETTISKLILYAGGFIEPVEKDNLNNLEVLSDNGYYYIPFNNNEINKEDLININTATKEELMTLPGIGEVKALSIIEYRKINGPFKALEDLMNVKGFGVAIYEQLHKKITI